MENPGIHLLGFFLWVNWMVTEQSEVDSASKLGSVELR